MPRSTPREATAAAAPAARPRPRRASARGAALSQVLARQTPIEWFEAVAIVQDLCSLLLEGPPSGGRGVPANEDIAILPEGQVELLAEGPADAPAVRVARLLHSLAEGTALPVQLRLLVLQELSPTPGCASVLEFSTRLALYERPGRAAMIRAVYERFTRLPPRQAERVAAAAAAPAARAAVARDPWWRKRAVVMVGGAVASLLVLYVLGSWLWGIVAPPSTGAPDTRGTVARAVGDAGASVAGAATESARTVSSWFGAEPGPARSSEPAVEPVEVVPQPSGSAPRRPQPVAAKPAPVAAPAGRAEEPRPVSADPNVFSAANADVVPPALERSRLPSSPPPGVRSEDLPEVEVVVSPQGQVESVKLLTPGAGVLPSMMLSAIKNWKFEPATRNGEAVRYRLRMRLTNHRPG
jgi:TonB family protein